MFTSTSGVCCTDSGTSQLGCRSLVPCDQLRDKPGEHKSPSGRLRKRKTKHAKASRKRWSARSLAEKMVRRSAGVAWEFSKTVLGSSGLGTASFKNAGRLPAARTG